MVSRNESRRGIVPSCTGAARLQGATTPCRNPIGLCALRKPARPRAMFPLPLTMSPAGLPRCGQSAGCGRLLPALFLSILVHVLAVLPPLFGVARGGGEGVASRHEITARLVSAAKADTSEDDGRPEDAFREEVAPSAPLHGNDSEALAPGTPAREGNSGKPEKNRGPGDGSSQLRYFPSDQLTVRPYPLTVLDDPGMLGPELDGRGDRVVLKVWISDSGEVTEMETEFTDMPVRIHEATVAAFRRMRFMPGEIDGRRVGSIMRIEMTYKDFRLPVE
jgi:hypothetical protein